jgi:oligopeptide/dipeptide ABC transporter ATP-binding protein
LSIEQQIKSAPSQKSSHKVTANIAQGKSGKTKDVLIEVKDLKKSFSTKKGSFFAVDGVNFSCNKGEILGIVGESGCGKTTLARMLVGLEEKTSGSILFHNKPLGSFKERSKEISQKIQMVFQNPEATLNPQKTIEQIITRPLALYNIVPKEQRKARAIELLKSVNLGAHYLEKYPHEISGGEKQRVGIARAFATDPEIIILDEPISSLDVSVQANILNLLQDLRQERNLTYIFIGHNLGVVRHLCDRIMVIYKGKICEMGSPEQIFQPPYHPYTEALLAAIPVIESDIEQRVVEIAGEGPNAVLSCAGCAFEQRCSFKISGVCEMSPPALTDCGQGHGIACHVPLSQLQQIEPVFKKIMIQEKELNNA